MHPLSKFYHAKAPSLKLDFKTTKDLKASWLSSIFHDHPHQGEIIEMFTDMFWANWWFPEREQCKDLLTADAQFPLSAHANTEHTTG